MKRSNGPAPGVVRAVLAGLLALALGTAGVAYGQENVTLADGSAPPAAFLKENGKLKVVWSAAWGVIPLAKPDPKSAKAAREPIIFGDAFYTVAEHVGPDATYDLLARPGRDRVSLGRHIGWVDRKSLVVRREAEVDEATHVARKVLIVNTVLSLQVRHKGELVTVSTRLGPSLDAPEGPKVGLTDLYFRYATREDSGRKEPARKNARKGEWVLIGPDPDLFAGATRTRPSFIGWVPAEMSVPFDGRLAVEWDREARRGANGWIFRNRPDAYNGRDGKTDVAPLFIEQPLEGGDTRSGPALPRFPLVRYVGDEDHPQIDPATGNELLKVVGLGAFLDAAEARREAAEVQHEVARIRARLVDPTQILFVIDDTQSMAKHFSKVAATIGSILKDAASGGRRPVEVAVAYYNDVGAKGTKTGYATMRLQSVKAEALPGFLDRVSRHPTVHGGDLPEMVFEGLAHAVDEAGWNEKSEAPKVVILIGDHGDTPQRTDPPRIAKALKGYGRPIEFHAYQVVDVPDTQPADQSVQEYEAARAFRSQMIAITTLMGGEPSASYTVVKGGGAKLSTDIDKKFGELKSRENDLQARLARLSARAFPAKVGGELEAILKEREVSLEELRSFDGLRVGHEGYLWLNESGPRSADAVPRPRQARIKVLLSRPEINRLVVELGPLAGADVLSALKARLGDKSSVSYESAVLRPLGLPARSPLLTQPLGRLTTRRAETLAAEARRRRGLLELLARETGEKARARFFRTPGGDVDWCWIDLEDELP